VRTWLREIDEHARSSDRIRYRFVATLPSNGEILGTTRIHIESAWDHQGSLGYGIRSPHRGRGYATEAAALALDFGFTTLELHRIEATVEPSNVASQRVVERLGMRREGLLVGRLKEPEGFRDALLYGITTDEWRGRPQR
jgi:[ribosomal protein S5]-alanine N-acetyltransferase